jgi:hypothetical protein
VPDMVVLCVLCQSQTSHVQTTWKDIMTAGKNPDGCSNILSSISPDPFYTSGWIHGKYAAMHDFMTNSSVTTRPNETMQSCPRTYCQGNWDGYRVGWNDDLRDANGPCFPGMQQLILAKCINGVGFDSKDYGEGYGQAATDFYNSLKGINHERTVCALGSRDNYYRWPINNTDACYAGYYDHILSLCYGFHTCYKYSPIKPKGYPPSSISNLPPHCTSSLLNGHLLKMGDAFFLYDSL